MKPTLWMMLACLALFNACRKSDDPGVLDLHVGYAVNGGPLVCDTLRYVNEAGNPFLVTEIQWFLSRLELQNEQGEWIAFGEGDQPYYIDTQLPETQTLRSQPLPTGHYRALRFTFGLDEADNRTGRFPNPPESNMFWPDLLGGGYHYMKLNGKWQDAEGRRVPLNIHLGIGQNESLTAFYPNHFSVTLPADLTLSAGQHAEAQLLMTIDNWFRSPHVYDFGTDGSAIMQNQAAQAKLKENGADVFSFHPIEAAPSLSERSLRIMKKAAPQPHFMTWEHLKETFNAKNTQERP